MCVHDTGLTDQKSGESDLVPNEDLQHPPSEDSDTDNGEDTNWGQYMPLSQNDDDNMIAGNHAVTDDEDNGSEDDDIDEEKIDSELACVSRRAHPVINNDIEKTDRLPSVSTIDLDEKKLQLVKDVMLTIELPPENIPEWAKNIPEDEWKNHLLQILHKEK